MKLIEAAANGETLKLLNNLLDNYWDNCKEAIIKYICKKISIEAQVLTHLSCFNGQKTSMKEFSFSEMCYQALKNSPILMNLLTVVAKNPRIGRNKLKNEFQITSDMMAALNTLLFCRNQNCSSVAMLVSLILRRDRQTNYVLPDCLPYFFVFPILQ